MSDDDRPDILIMDGFDDCFMGTVARCGHPEIACYNRLSILRRHMKAGMSYEEAVEFYEFNQVGAWMGELTPCFLTPREFTTLCDAPLK